MTLTEKYKDLVATASQLGLQLKHVTEGGGTLYVAGTAATAGARDAFLEKVKSYPGWEAEVVAEITVA